MNKWRIRKRSDRWVLSRPTGEHFGMYLTWHEAMAQTGRSIQGRSASGGNFSLRGEYDHDSRHWSDAFGFTGPVRA